MMNPNVPFRLANARESFVKQFHFQDRGDYLATTHKITIGYKELDAWLIAFAKTVAEECCALANRFEDASDAVKWIRDIKWEEKV